MSGTETVITGGGGDLGGREHSLSVAYTTYNLNTNFNYFELDVIKIDSVKSTRVYIN